MSQVREVQQVLLPDINDVLTGKFGFDCLIWILHPARVHQEQAVQHLLELLLCHHSALYLLRIHLSFLLSFEGKAVIVLHLWSLLLYLHHIVHVLYFQWELGPLLATLGAATLLSFESDGSTPALCCSSQP